MSFVGKWIFDKKTQEFKFEKYAKNEASQIKPDMEIKVRESKLNVFDSSPITLQDVSDQVLKLAPDGMKSMFQEMACNTQLITFLKYTVIYFDQFLKTVEYLLIRRDMIEGQSDFLMQNFHSVENERKVSEILSHKRLLLAREFSKILTKQVYVSKYFNNTNYNGALAFEAFLAFLHLFVYISLHRVGYCTIKHEIDRLFRSAHFKSDTKNTITFTLREQQVLHGINGVKGKCSFFAMSPLISEIAKVNRLNKEILWIGDNKYMGPSKYLWDFEKPYITSFTQLNAIDKNVGVIGHPKRLYDKHLNRDLRKIRKEKFDDSYDIYRLYRKPHLIIPQQDLSLESNPKTIPVLKLSYKPKYDPMREVHKLL